MYFICILMAPRVDHSVILHKKVFTGLSPAQVRLTKDRQVKSKIEKGNRIRKIRP